ncbi:MAG: hypothetical protein IJ660_04850 [Alphaproteobacteria bacterium]|nr:hypothetical protein [Alphaproteobacteria bacterium]
MKKENTPAIPVRSDVAQPENCAHHWVKIQTPHGKALKCEFCGKVIDSQD